MAVLKIYNEIVPDGCMWLFGEGAVSYTSVDEFLHTIAEDDDEIDIRLHCPGGSVMEGWAIVDALRATGKKISATIEGQCASMASVILLAASERKGYEHASLLIHNPYYPEGALWEAQGVDDLERKAEMLRKDREMILDFYVERTGADRAELEALMAEDKFVDMTKAKELGFIHEIVAPRSASVRKAKAEILQHNNLKTQNEMAKTKIDASSKKSLLAKIVALFENDPVAYELETESGEMITIEKPEGEEPAVGDKAYPDGEHKMTDGKTIKVETGEIVEIVAPEEEEKADEEPKEDDELEVAKARIAELEATIAEMNDKLTEASANAKSTEEVEILAAVERAGGVKALASIATKHIPEQRGADIAPVAERVSKTAAKLAELKKHL